MKKGFLKRFALVLLILVQCVSLLGCNVKEDKSFQSMENFESAVIGVLTGSSFDLLAKEHFPEAEKLYYMNIADLVLNLKQGKIDGILMDMGYYTPIIWAGESLSHVEMEMPATEYAVAFPKTSESETLKEQFDAFIRGETENGSLAELNAKWFSASEPGGTVDFSQLTGENGTLRVATTVECKPFSYLKDGAYCGLDAEFLFRFAEKYGYALEIETMDFGALLPSLSAGKFDLAVSGITVTEERKETVLFSDTYCRSPIVMAILADGKDQPAVGGTKLSDYANAKIGIMTGSSHDITVRERFPDAQRVYFTTFAEELLAVEQGKVDCYIEDVQFLIAAQWEGVNVKRLAESVKQVENGFAFPQGEQSRELREQINDFIAAAKADGTIDRLMEKWLADAEPTEHPDYTTLTGENGTIRLAVVVESKPMIYLRNGICTGFEIELLTLFAQQYGYAFEVEEVPFTSVIAGLTAGKYNMAASSLNITPEREESIDFSDAYASFDVVMAVKDDGADSAGKKPAMTIADLDTATIGIVTGTSLDLIAQKQFPNAERKYFSASADLLLALQQKKIDAFFADRTVYAGIRWENGAITAIDEPIGQVSNALIFSKEGYDENLLAQVNAFIAKSKENGTLDRLSAKWFADAEPEEHPDYTRLKGENGTIRVAVCDAQKPVSYQKGSMYTGYEVEFLTLFAEEYGYQLDLQGMSFDALIPSVAGGKCSIGACGITITPERAENVTFSDPHMETQVVVVVRGGADESRNNQKTLADFENATLGILSGSSYDPLARERFPNAQRQYYSILPDMILAVEQGKIDAYITETTYLAAAIWEGAKVEAAGEPIDRTNAGYIFQKDGANAAVRSQLNEYLTRAKENGQLDKLQKKWLGSAEPTDLFDPDTLTGENGTLKVAISPDLKPLCYMKDGVVVGYEIEVLQQFAKEYGYQLEFISMTFDAILPGVVAGKYDIGTGGMTITEERAQSVDFSESYLTVDVVMVIKAEPDVAAEPGFWDELKEDFAKTFIREDRWKLIVQGIGVTMLISLSAAAAGSVLGFGLYMLSRSDSKFLQMLAKKVAGVYSRIVEGTPTVVILMILFYVVFGKVRDMSGILVAILGFTLTFGAFVYDHMTVSVGSVDRGQIEAAYALGYTKNKTFFRIVFPQAMTIFLPSYCGQAVELIKATAVVGYVAVNDLTKMGDIIRSNTYEAFFPLIATAVIYFLLTWLLSLALKLVKLRFEPKRRSKEDILKGVKTV